MVSEARDAKVLSGVNEKYRGLLTDLVNKAAWTIKEYRYEQVRLATTQRGFAIETRTVGGRTHREKLGLGQVREALSTSGIAAYARANTNVRPQTLEKTLAEVGGKRWVGTIFDSSDTAPGKRLEEVRAAALVEFRSP